MSIERPLFRLAFLLCATSLSGCVVVPKQTAVYDPKCKVATQKVTLDIQSMESAGVTVCTEQNCVLSLSKELSYAMFTTATSAVVAGSIAVAGNTKYLLETGGECPNSVAEAQQTNEAQTPREYIIVEEIVAARPLNPN